MPIINAVKSCHEHKLRLNLPIYDTTVLYDVFTTQQLQ